MAEDLTTCNQPCLEDTTACPLSSSCKSINKVAIAEEITARHCLPQPIQGLMHDSALPVLLRKEENCPQRDKELEDCEPLQTSSGQGNGNPDSCTSRNSEQEGHSLIATHDGLVSTSRQSTVSSEASAARETCIQNPLNSIEPGNLIPKPASPSSAAGSPQQGEQNSEEEALPAEAVALHTLKVTISGLEVQNLDEEGLAKEDAELCWLQYTFSEDVQVRSQTFLGISDSIISLQTLSTSL